MKSKSAALTRIDSLHGIRIQPDEAVFYPFDRNHVPVSPPTYICVEGESQGRKYRAYLKTRKDTGGAGDDIFVAQETLEKLVAAPHNTVPVSYWEIPARVFYWQRLLTDPRQKPALFGLAVALVGTIIDKGFTVGAVWPLITLNTAQAVIFMALSTVMQIGGLFFTVWKGFLGGS